MNNKSYRIADMNLKTFDILVCPVTKAPLRYLHDKQELLSSAAGLAYPVRNGIPIMLVDQARTLSPDELSALTS